MRPGTKNINSPRGKPVHRCVMWPCFCRATCGPTVGWAHGGLGVHV